MVSVAGVYSSLEEEKRDVLAICEWTSGAVWKEEEKLIVCGRASVVARRGRSGVSVTRWKSLVLGCKLWPGRRSYSIVKGEPIRYYHYGRLN